MVRRVKQLCSFPKANCIGDKSKPFINYNIKTNISIQSSQKFSSDLSQTAFHEMHTNIIFSFFKNIFLHLGKIGMLYIYIYVENL